MARTVRLTAKHAAVYLGGAQIADCYDCTVEVSQDLVEHRAWGDTWKQREADIGDWKVTAKKYTTTVGMGAFLDATGTQVNAASQLAVTVIVYQKLGDPTSKIIEGPVWFSRASLMLGEGKMVDEDIEMMAAGDPTSWIGM